MYRKEDSNMQRIFFHKYDQPIWSISVCKGSNLIDMLDTKKFNKPVLTAEDVKDIKAEFVADPFIIKYRNKFYMFFEVVNSLDKKGVIGLASSDCGLKWKYERVILNESFHLSYPYVFQYGNEYYMIPECGESGYIKLYISRNFPYEWECIANLIEGDYGDATFFYHNEKFWLFTEKESINGERNCNLHLYYSDSLENGWREHPKSPIITNNIKKARPAGRILNYDHNIFRFSQNDYPYYGKNINMFKIKKLTTNDYEEEEIKVNLKESGTQKAWNKDGVHHIDACKINENEWLVSIDGHYFKKIGFIKHKYDRIIMKVVRLLK